MTTFGVGAILRPLEITNGIHVLLLLWRSCACIPQGTALLSVFVAGASAGGFGGAAAPPTSGGMGLAPNSRPELYVCDIAKIAQLAVCGAGEFICFIIIPGQLIGQSSKQCWHFGLWLSCW